MLEINQLLEIAEFIVSVCSLILGMLYFIWIAWEFSAVKDGYMVLKNTEYFMPHEMKKIFRYRFEANESEEETNEIVSWDKLAGKYNEQFLTKEESDKK